MARTLTFTVPSALANFTVWSVVFLAVTRPVGSSVTVEILPTASSWTPTVSLVPSNWNDAVIPPVWAIGSFVLAAAAPGNAKSRTVNPRRAKIGRRAA